MERRNFFKHGATAAGLMVGANLIGQTDNSVAGLDNHTAPYHYQQSLDSYRQMPGFLLNFIVRKEQTNGAYAILEGRARKGGEPPLHVHEYEDEAFYMLEGEMMVVVGEEEYHLKPGDYAFLPRRIPHTQRFLTDTVHVLLYISPGGLEDYFWDLSQPAKDKNIPPLMASTEPPSKEMMQMMMDYNKRYGISHP